jgi:ABC-2 type transport system permease protein
MIAEFKHTLRRFRGSMIGWSIGVGLYGLMMASMFSSVSQIEGLEELMASYPQELMAFFGGMIELRTPKGYLNTYYFLYMDMIIGIFAIGAAASLLVRDEEEGILDLLMAHPVSRAAFFWGRVLGYLVAIAVILLAGWLSWVIPSGASGMDLTWLEFLRPFVPLFGQLVLYGSLALALSLLLPARRMASGLSSALLVGNFLLMGLAGLNDKLQPVLEYTPRQYFQGGDAVNGINWGWLLPLLGASLVMMLVAWWRFQRRDIRVGGEAGWKLTGLRLRRKGDATA